MATRRGMRENGINLKIIVSKREVPSGCFLQVDYEAVNTCQSFENKTATVLAGSLQVQSSLLFSPSNFD